MLVTPTAVWLRPTAATMLLPRFNSVNARCKKEYSVRSLDAQRYPATLNWFSYPLEIDLNLSPLSPGSE